MPMGITLYALDSCPYCEAVSEKLDAANIEYDTNWVDALHSQRNDVKRVSGQRAVPVLVDTDRGVTMAESENIRKYIDRTLV